MRPGPKKCRETLVQELDGVFRQNHELMYQIAFRVTKNHHDAEEVLQKIFMRLMQGVIRGAPPPSDFVKNAQGYLYRPRSTKPRVCFDGASTNQCTSTSTRWKSLYPG